MAPLTSDVQQLIATISVVMIVPMIVIPVSMMLMRQLRWFGFRAFEREE